MSVKRINPLTASVDRKTKELANNNSIESTDKCPANGCTTPMRVLNCNGIPCFVCLTHRIALPTKDA